LATDFITRKTWRAGSQTGQERPEELGHRLLEKDLESWVKTGHGDVTTRKT
jgi:hypothetical protein